MNVLDAQVLQRMAEHGRDGGLRLAGGGGPLQELTRVLLESMSAPGDERGDAFRPVTAGEASSPAAPPRAARPGTARGTGDRRRLRSRGLERMVLSLSTGGLTPDEISAHLADAYGATVGAERIAGILEREVAGLDAWLSRPLDPVYPVLFVDAVNVMTGARSLDGRRIYVVFAVTMIGRRDILGLWGGDAAADDADYWLGLLGGIRGRGVADVCIVACCEDLPGLAEAAQTIWPRALSFESVIPLIRRACRCAPGDTGAARSVCMAATPEGAAAGLAKLLDTWQRRCPSLAALWRRAWPGLREFLRLDVEIRRVICRIEAIEAVTSRIVRAVRTPFPDTRAALKPAYLAVLSLEPAYGGRRQWTTRWKPARSAFIAAFPDRLGPETSIPAGIAAD